MNADPTPRMVTWINELNAFLSLLQASGLTTGAGGPHTEQIGKAIKAGEDLALALFPPSSDSTPTSPESVTTPAPPASSNPASN